MVGGWYANNTIDGTGTQHEINFSTRCPNERWYSSDVVEERPTICRYIELFKAN
jgi:hypothetical protein